MPMSSTDTRYQELLDWLKSDLDHAFESITRGLHNHRNFPGTETCLIELKQKRIVFNDQYL